MLQIQTIIPKESFGSNMYILRSGGDYAVIDPSVGFSEAASRFPELKHGTKYIILTHAHFDHFLAIDSWVNETNAQILVGRLDAPSLSDSYKNAYKIFFGQDKGYFGAYTAVDDGNQFRLGDESFKILSAPGHTPGGICLLFSDCIFVGDTVFADGGYGRYDLPGGDFSALANSIRRISSLGTALRAYPGHGRPTDIGEIQQYFSQF